MNGTRARSPLTLIIAGMVIALGAAIDTAYGQFFPMCGLNLPGCNPIVNCTGGGGNCNNGPPPTPYNASNQTAVPYKICTGGNINNCPNPMPPVPFCVVDGFTANLMGNCVGFICAVVKATPGC